MEATLAHNLMKSSVDEILNDIVGHVHTPRAKGRVLTEDPDVDRQIFIARNKEAQVCVCVCGCMCVCIYEYLLRILMLIDRYSLLGIRRPRYVCVYIHEYMWK